MKTSTMKTYTMKTYCTLLAIGIWCALGCASAGAYDYLDYEDKFPEEHLGARHFLFSGTQTILGGVAMPGLFSGHNELVLSVPDLGIDEVAFPLYHTRYSGWELFPTEWGRMVYELEGTQAGVFTFVGTDEMVSETQGIYRIQMAGYFTGGPLAGASLLAIGRIENTNWNDRAGYDDIPGTVEGVLIVPFYTDFPPFKDMETLPPLKPVTELPSGIGWSICEVDQPKRLVDYWPQDDDHVYSLFDTILSCADLDLHDLWLPELYHGYAPLPVGGRYGTSDFLPADGVHEFPELPPGDIPSDPVPGFPCGETARQGMMGRSKSNSRYIYEDYAGVFWSGPLAGCLYLRSESAKVPVDRGDSVDDVSTILLIPDEADLGARSPQKFLNVSERGMVGTGDDVLITGFVVSGESPRTVLVRAIGPGLAQFGVTDYLTDPVLKVFRDGVEVGSNENWGESLNREVIAEMSQKAGAFALESDSNDAAILFSWLEPGAYTVHVSGAEGTSGVALAEVYQIGD